MKGKFCDLSNHITTKHEYILKYNNHNTKGKNRKWKSTKCGHSDPWKYEKSVVRSIKTKKKFIWLQFSQMSYKSYKYDNNNQKTMNEKQQKHFTNHYYYYYLEFVHDICCRECKDNPIKSRKRFGKCVPLQLCDSKIST